MSEELNQGAQAPAATEPVATPTPTAQPEATPSPATGTPDPMAEAAAQGAQQNADVPDPMAEAAKKPEEPKSQAPEKYENFKFGDQEFSAETTAAFAEVARKNGLSQEQAQEYVNSIVPALQAQALSNQKSWLDACQKDAEIGGEHLRENMAVAGAGYRQFASDDLQAVLKATGLSRHPAVVRHFYRLGKTLQQDSGVAGGASAPAPKVSFYPNSDMVRDIE